MSNKRIRNNQLESKLEAIHKFSSSLEQAPPLPVRELQRTLDKLIPPQVQEISNRFNNLVPPELAKHNEQLSNIMGPVAEYIQQFNVRLKEHKQKFELWLAHNKIHFTDLVSQGWYPTSMTFYSKPEHEFDLEHYMVQALKENWKELSREIIDSYPNRSHILEVAFDLHEKGNYIASIPLLYAQADGICCEHFKSFLFAGNKVSDSIDNLETDSMLEVFLTPYRLKNHHNAGISCHKSNRIAPNRNGILHGHRKHLSYGTEVNSLKAFSLLCFVVMSVELLKDS
ncbi:hypothetical protein [Pseudoalteromonas piscicida]|uniref:hypothetical protein n=1 Tax=Pseudoalteromonas piscicida TaxID=43662 RepID=UPI0030AF4E94